MGDNSDMKKSFFMGRQPMQLQNFSMQGFQDVGRIKSLRKDGWKKPRDFFAILGRGPRAFQIEKLLNWELCYRAQLYPLW